MIMGKVWADGTENPKVTGDARNSNSSAEENRQAIPETASDATTHSQAFFKINGVKCNFQNFPSETT